MRYYYTPGKWLSSKRIQITNAGKNVEKRKPSYIVGVGECIAKLMQSL